MKGLVGPLVDGGPGPLGPGPPALP